MKHHDMIETMNKCPHSSIGLALLIGFLTGVIVGFLASPVKNGVTIASNNTLTGGDDGDDERECFV